MTNERLQEIKTSIFVFTVKLLVFFVVLLAATEFWLPSFKEMNESIKQGLTERNKLLLFGLVQNPAALYQASEIAEKQGFLDIARRDMELAVGLVELHATDKRPMKRYYDRLDALKSKTGG